MVLENLTECEQLVMKTVWDAADEIGLMEIMERANDRYHKAWAPQTVSTFLACLVRKGYLRHYRQGRVFLYRILIPLEEYRAQLTNDYVDFWNHGNADEFLCALAQKRLLRPDEIDRIKAFVNDVYERQKGESMKRTIVMITCDRCGKEIPDDPVRIVPHHVPRSSGAEDGDLYEGRNELPLWIERMANKDFCEECTAEIVEFALKTGEEFEDAMDRVAQVSLPDISAELNTLAQERPLRPDEILHLVNERTEKEDGSDGPEETSDTESVDWNSALDRMEQANQPDESVTEPQETVPDQLGGGEEQSRQAETKEPGKQTGRKKLDQGKIMALHRAGWSNARIAEEMGTTKATIAVTISKLKSNRGDT